MAAASNPATTPATTALPGSSAFAATSAVNKATMTAMASHERRDHASVKRARICSTKTPAPIDETGERPSIAAATHGSAADSKRSDGHSGTSGGVRLPANAAAPATTSAAAAPAAHAGNGP